MIRSRLHERVKSTREIFRIGPIELAILEIDVVRLLNHPYERLCHGGTPLSKDPGGFYRSTCRAATRHSLDGGHEGRLRAWPWRDHVTRCAGARRSVIAERAGRAGEHRPKTMHAGGHRFAGSRRLAIRATDDRVVAHD